MKKRGDRSHTRGARGARAPAWTALQVLIALVLDVSLVSTRTRHPPWGSYSRRMSSLRLCPMTEFGEEAAKARPLGLALLDASRTYEGFVIPSYEGRLRRRRLPPHRRAIIGLSPASAVFSAPHIRLPMQGRCWKRSGHCVRCWSSSSASAGSRTIQTATGNSGWRTTMLPVTCGERGFGSMHRRCTTPPWNRSHPSSARKVRRLPLGACSSRPNSETDSPVTGATSNSGPPRSA